MADDYDYRMSDMEYKLFELKDQATQQDNNEPHLNALMENKANLMDPNKNHHLTLDIDQIDAYVQKKASASGNVLYRFPGQLVESDDERNAADVEDNCLFKRNSEKSDAHESDTDSWQNGMSDGSNFSFNSGKLFDGYKDFVEYQQKQEIKEAQESAGDGEGGPKPKKKEAKKPRRGRQQRARGTQASEDDNPFGKQTAPKAKKTKSNMRSRSSSPSLNAVFDFDKGFIVDNPDEDADNAAEFDLNISFSGGYVPNTDLSRVDKGQGNP